jgi:hypothetical protein
MTDLHLGELFVVGSRGQVVTAPTHLLDDVFVLQRAGAVPVFVNISEAEVLKDS